MVVAISELMIRRNSPANRTRSSTPPPVLPTPRPSTSRYCTAPPRSSSSASVQAYSFTSAPTAKALVGAHKRGVKVQVILERSQRTEKYSSADFVAHAGIPLVQIDAARAIAHNKVMVVDGETVITGTERLTR